MKKLLSIILSIAMLLLMVTVAFADGISGPMQPVKIKVGINAQFPPLEYYDENGELYGFDIDLMNCIGERNGFEIEYVDMSFDKLFSAVMSGEVACAISAISITEERNNVIDYTIPYLSAKVTYFDGEISDASIEQYAVVFPNNSAEKGKLAEAAGEPKKSVYNLVNNTISDLIEDKTIERLGEKYNLNKAADTDDFDYEYTVMPVPADFDKSNMDKSEMQSSAISVESSDWVKADGVDEVRVAAFTTVKIPFPDDIESRDSWLTRARYRDSGEVIALSMSYDGCVHATIPAENKGRQIEAFVPEELIFTDIDDSNPDFHDFMMLSRVGVIRGNDKGEANIYDNITRAEAVAMVMRFIGLEGLAWEYVDEISAGYKKTATFEDVSKKDWFYYVVTYARLCGIIEGDSPDRFSPNRDVTREEIAVMIARALQYANLRCSKSRATNYGDEDKISDWAKDAYEYIGRNIVSDYDDTDYENPIRLLNPQKVATRADVAYILNNTQRDCQLYDSELAEMFGFDKEMPVIDGSTSTYPFTEAVYNMLFRNGQTHPLFPQSHSKSHASYQRLINGEVDMLFASVYPASDILKIAEDKGVELELIPIAYDAMIFFTNKDNPIEGLTKEQISNIYVSDAYDNWSEVGGSDALMYPYCRNNDSGSHAQMEKHFLKGNEIHPEVKKETSYTMSNVLTDVIAAKTEKPIGYGLGYSIYYYYHNVDAVLDTKRHLKLLAIDGIMPSDETIADGSYPLSNNTYVVLRKDTPADSPARKMAEFMLTEAGQVCVENAGFGRLK